ncbi:hypothetical protein HJG60_010019 [Phyllostomus discolor]|uniref:Uncharacterized protein n=1 Tax=Phyllostomus discolor TaxID=89673 RepID=A0A834EME6_9CHIR|nr:hypothetical protein HJG60_010019 [Phyllostomus discolor]
MTLTPHVDTGLGQTPRPGSDGPVDVHRTCTAGRRDDGHKRPSPRVLWERCLLSRQPSTSGCPWAGPGGLVRQLSCRANTGVAHEGGCQGPGRRDGPTRGPRARPHEPWLTVCQLPRRWPRPNAPGQDHMSRRSSGKKVGPSLRGSGVAVGSGVSTFTHPAPTRGSWCQGHGRVQIWA